MPELVGRSPTVVAPASTFRHAGSGGHQLSIEKAAVADKASLLFRTGASGRAEIGLDGSDRFSVSVSEDGGAWRAALTIHPATGNFGLGASDPAARLHVHGTAFVSGNVGIGSVPDTDNRLIVSGSNVLFTSGASLRSVLNKGRAADDAALMFQTGFSARALIGLLADDNFTFKVSADGQSYRNALVISKDTGAVTFESHAKFSAFANFGQNYAAGAWRDMLLNTARHNDQNAFASVGNVGVFTAPSAGCYAFGAGATFETTGGTAPTRMAIGLSVNGAAPTSDTVDTAGDATFVTLETAVSTTGLLKLNAGDVVRAQLFFTTNAGRVAANLNYLWGYRVP